MNSISAAAASLLLVLVLCSSNGNNFAQAQTIGEYIENNDDFNTLESLLDLIDPTILNEYYRNVNNMDTFFAPTNQAFDNLDQTFLDNMKLPVFYFHLDGILLGLVSFGVVIRADDIADGDVLTMGSRDEVTFSRSDDGNITIDPGNVAIITPNIDVTNGVVHAVDSVLLPRWADINALDAILQFPQDLSTFYSLVERSELFELLKSNSITLLAPTNQAFAAAFAADPTLEQALQDTIFVTFFVAYHTLPDVLFQFFLDQVPPAFPTYLLDQTISITTEVLEQNQIAATFDGTAKYLGELVVNNGVVAIIDAVLTAPNAVEVLIDQEGSFDTLIELVLEAELADTLATSRNYTLFAPNQAAFAKLPELLLGNLKSRPFRAHLTDILLNHVHFDTLVSADTIPDGATLQTANMGELSFEVLTGGEIIINGNIAVLEANLIAFSNPAAIHTIDTVVTPPWIGFNTLSIAPTIGNFTLFTQVVELVEALKDTLTGDLPITVFLVPDSAFLQAEADEPGLIDYLENDAEAATSVLNAHVVQGIVMTNVISNGIAFKSIGGDDLVFGVAADGAVTVNGVTIQQTDVLTENGVVHVLGDGIIKPAGFALPTTSAPVTTNAPVGTDAPAPTMSPTMSGGYGIGAGGGLALSVVFSMMGLVAMIAMV